MAVEEVPGAAPENFAESFTTSMDRQMAEAGTIQSKQQSIQRLIWLMEESTRRIGQEKLRYFTDGLQPLTHEIWRIVKTLQISSPPFRLTEQQIPETDERSNRLHTQATLWLIDPTLKSGTEVLLWADWWKDRSKKTVERRDRGDAALIELRQRTLNTLQRWIDWMKAEATKEPVDEVPELGAKYKPASVNALMLDLMQKHGREECLVWSVRRWALELEPRRGKKPSESAIHGTPTYKLLKGLRDEAKASMVERQTEKDNKGKRRSTRF